MTFGDTVKLLIEEMKVRGAAFSVGRKDVYYFFEVDGENVGVEVLPCGTYLRFNSVYKGNGLLKVKARTFKYSTSRAKGFDFDKVYGYFCAQAAALRFIRDEGRKESTSYSLLQRMKKRFPDSPLLKHAQPSVDGVKLGCVLTLEETLRYLEAFSKLSVPEDK